MAWTLSHGASISVLVLLGVFSLLALCLMAIIIMYFKRTENQGRAEVQGGHGNDLEPQEHGEGQDGRGYNLEPQDDGEGQEGHGNNLELQERGEAQGGRLAKRSPGTEDAHESEESRVERQGQEDHPHREGHADQDLHEYPELRDHQGQDGHQSRTCHRSDEHISSGGRNNVTAIEEQVDEDYGR